MDYQSHQHVKIFITSRLNPFTEVAGIRCFIVSLGFICINLPKFEVFSSNLISYAVVSPELGNVSIKQIICDVPTFILEFNEKEFIFVIINMHIFFKLSNSFCKMVYSEPKEVEHYIVKYIS